MIRKLLCRILGHDRMTTRTKWRVCQRCGLKETQRHFGSLLAWEEIS